MGGVELGEDLIEEDIEEGDFGGDCFWCSRWSRGCSFLFEVFVSSSTHLSDHNAAKLNKITIEKNTIREAVTLILRFHFTFILLNLYYRVDSIFYEFIDPKLAVVVVKQTKYEPPINPKIKTIKRL